MVSNELVRFDHVPVESTALIPLELARDRLRSLGQSVVDSKVNQAHLLIQMREKYTQAAQLERESFERVLMQMKERAINQHKTHVELIQQLKAEIEELKQALLINQSVNQPVVEPVSLIVPIDSTSSNVTQPDAVPSQSNPETIQSDQEAIVAFSDQSLPQNYQTIPSTSPTIDLDSDILQLLHQFGITSLDSERNAQLDELEALLAEAREINIERTTLASTVSAIKARQAELQVEKRDLIALREQRACWTKESDEAVAFDLRKAALADAGTQLRQEHSQLEAKLSAFRTREAAIQSSLCKFNIDSQPVDDTTDVDQTKRKRRMSPVEEEQIERICAHFHTLRSTQTASPPLDTPQAAEPAQGSVDGEQTKVSSHTSTDQTNSTNSSLSPILSQPDPPQQHNLVSHHSSSAQPPSLSSFPSTLTPADFSRIASSAPADQLQIASLEQQILEFTEQLQQAHQRIAELESRPPLYLPVEPVKPASPVIEPDTTTNPRTSPPDAAVAERDAIRAELVSAQTKFAIELEQARATAKRDLEQARTVAKRDLEQAQALSKQELEQQHSKHLQDLTAERAATSHALETLRAETKSQASIAELSINEAHSKQIVAIRAEVDAAQTAKAQVTQELVASRTAHDSDKATLTKLQQEHKQLQKKFTSLSKESKEAIESAASLKGTIERLDSSLKSEQAALASITAERDSLFQRYHEEQTKRKEFQFKYEDAKGKVRVYARVRPFVRSEIDRGEATLLRMGKNDWTLELNETQRDLFNHVTEKWRDFSFDAVFHPGLDGVSGPAKATGDQEHIFEETRTFGDLAMQGINACVFAYGQSGTGKTFTMAGTREQPGLKPRMIKYVYELADRSKLTHQYNISCYLIEIYLNRLEDLGWKTDHHRDKSKHEAPELKLRIDSKNKRVHIDNVTMKTFVTADDMLTFCDEAEKLRRVRKTGLNEASSRSHLVFALCIESTELKSGRTLKGKLSLVDLAGSERADKTNVDGLSKAAREAMMEEGVAINESLRMLKNVFRILGTANQPAAKNTSTGPTKASEVVQYRGNALTELMQDSLGGNAKTLMFVNVGPAASNIGESIDSLSYADLVKNITMEKASADEDLAPVVRRLREQIAQYEQKGSAAAV